MDTISYFSSKRQAILNAIRKSPPLSVTEIISKTGYPSFVVRHVVSDLFRQRKIERTGCSRGVGRYCPAGQKDRLIRVNMETAKIFAERHNFAKAMQVLQGMQHTFLLPPDRQERFDMLLSKITLSALNEFYRDRTAKKARLHQLAKYLGLSSGKTRQLLAPHLASGILIRNHSGFFSHNRNL